LQKEGGQACSSNADGARPIWRSVWKLPIPKKIKLFVCRVVMKALSTRANKFKKLEPQNTCEMCGRALETEHHALVECPHANRLWTVMVDHWDLPTQAQVRFTGPEWLLNLISRLSAHEGSSEHNKKLISCNTSAGFQQKYLAEIIKAHDSTPTSDVKGKSATASRVIQKRCTKPRSRDEEEWQAPSDGWIKINVDGAFTKE
jgi:hypothetical protein